MHIGAYACSICMCTCNCECIFHVIRQAKLLHHHLNVHNSICSVSLSSPLVNWKPQVSLYCELDFNKQKINKKMNYANWPCLVRYTWQEGQRQYCRRVAIHFVAILIQKHMRLCKKMNCLGLSMQPAFSSCPPRGSVTYAVPSHTRLYHIDSLDQHVSRWHIICVLQPFINRSYHQYWFWRGAPHGAALRLNIVVAEAQKGCEAACLEKPLRLARDVISSAAPSMTFDL